MGLPDGLKEPSIVAHGFGGTVMSLIHTYELSGDNPFDYLAELLRHSRMGLVALGCSVVKEPLFLGLALQSPISLKLLLSLTEPAGLLINRA